MKVTVFDLIFDRCALEAARALAEEIDEEIIQQIMAANKQSIFQ